MDNYDDVSTDENVLIFNVPDEVLERVGVFRHTGRDCAEAPDDTGPECHQRRGNRDAGRLSGGCRTGCHYGLTDGSP